MSIVVVILCIHCWFSLFKYLNCAKNALNLQIDQYETEIESLHVGNKKKKVDREVNIFYLFFNFCTFICLDLPPVNDRATVMFSGFCY